MDVGAAAEAAGAAPEAVKPGFQCVLARSNPGFMSSWAVPGCLPGGAGGAGVTGVRSGGFWCPSATSKLSGIGSRPPRCSIVVLSSPGPGSRTAIRRTTGTIRPAIRALTQGKPHSCASESAHSGAVGDRADTIRGPAPGPVAPGPADPVPAPADPVPQPSAPSGPLAPCGPRGPPAPFAAALCLLWPLRARGRPCGPVPPLRARAAPAGPCRPCGPVPPSPPSRIPRGVREGGVRRRRRVEPVARLANLTFEARKALRPR
jgi:hypothetical protein